MIAQSQMNTMNMASMNERHIPSVAEPINRPQPLNYADILKELDQSVQQPPPPPPQTPPVAPPPVVPTPTPPVQAVVAPTVHFADPIVQQAPIPKVRQQAPLPLDKGPIEDSFFVRYRRHLFVAAVAFVVLHYASPYMSSVSYLNNGLVRSAATAALIAGLFYAGDVFILSPETILEVAR